MRLSRLRTTADWPHRHHGHLWPCSRNWLGSLMKGARAPHWVPGGRPWFPLHGRTLASNSTLGIFILWKAIITPLRTVHLQVVIGNHSVFILVGLLFFPLHTQCQRASLAQKIVFLKNTWNNTWKCETGGLSSFSGSAFNNFKQQMIIYQHNARYSCLQRKWSDRQTNVRSWLPRLQG